MHTATAIGIQSDRILAFFRFIPTYSFIKTFKFFSFASASPFFSLAGSGTVPKSPGKASRNVLYPPRRSSVLSFPNTFYLLVRLILQRTIPIPATVSTAIPIGNRIMVVSPVFTSSDFSGVFGSFLFWISFTTSMTFVLASV